MLTKDYTQSAPFCSRSFKKGEVGSIIACGHSIYGYEDQTNSLSVLVDGDECYRVDVGTPIPDFDNSEGFVKAKDSRMLSNEDFGLD